MASRTKFLTVPDLDEYVESQVKQEAGPQPTAPPRKQVRRPSDIIPFSKRNG